MGLSTISRAKRDQTWREDVVTNGIGRVEGIAVDWIAGEQWGSGEERTEGNMESQRGKGANEELSGDQGLRGPGDMYPYQPL